MTINWHRSLNHHAQLLWLVIVLVLLVTFFVDFAGWFHGDGILP